MKSKTTSFLCNLILISSLAIIPVIDGTTFGQDKQMETPKFARQRIEILRQTAKALQELANQPLPANLPASEQTEANRFTLWLKNSSQRLYDLANRWQADLNKAVQTKTNDPKTQTNTMREMNQAYYLKYIGLENKLSDENRRFTLIPNIMKSNHDSAKNRINNIR